MRILVSSFSMIILSLIANVTALSGRTNAAAPASFEVSKETSAVIRAGGRTVLEYRDTASPYKPCVRQLFTPGGVQILRDSPFDHKHHHALMFAIGANGVNFWEEGGGSGSEKPRGPLDTASGRFHDAPCERLIQNLDWTDARGKQLLVEHREVGVVALQESAPVTFVLWDSELSPAAGVDAVKLGGNSYYGLGMRFLTSMDSGGRFFNSSKQSGEAIDPNNRGARLVAAKWCAYTAKAESKPVTVAIFDHPSNPRHPNKIFTLTGAFAYLSATLDLWREPLVVKAGAKLKLSYAVAVWDGETPAEQIQSLYEKWSEAK